MTVSIIFIIAAILFAIVDLFAQIHSMKNADTSCAISGEITGLLGVVLLLAGIFLKIIYNV